MTRGRRLQSRRTRPNKIRARPKQLQQLHHSNCDSEISKPRSTLFCVHASMPCMHALLQQSSRLSDTSPGASSKQGVWSISAMSVC